MKNFALAMLLVLVAPPILGQPAPEDTVAQREAVERERIRQTRATEQSQFEAQEVECYRRFAVNDCLVEVRSRRREVLGDLRRQEISLNDAQRKRRAAEQLLRSDARAPRAP